MKTLETKDLTPFDKTQARIAAMSKKLPTAIVIAMNDRDPKYHDLYRVDLLTGGRKQLLKNERYVSFVYDDSLTVRCALEPRADGGSELLEADGKGGFKPFQTIPPENSLTTSPAGLDKSGRLLYLSESRDRDTSALVAFDTKTRKQQLLAEDARADLSEVTASPRDWQIAGELPVASPRHGAGRQRQAEGPLAFGALGARRPLGSGQLHLQHAAPVAGHARLCGAERELSGLHRLREGVHQRGRQAVGRQDAGRPARRRGLGGDERHRRPRARGDHGRQLRRLCHVGGAELHPRRLCLWHRPGGRLQPQHAAGQRSAVLGTHAGAVCQARR